MRRLILLASFAVLFTPFIASARGLNSEPEYRHHRKIGAAELATAGFAAAGLIGVAGYLVLRKRSGE